jgi:hypothetical protein
MMNLRNCLFILACFNYADASGLRGGNQGELIKNWIKKSAPIVLFDLMVSTPPTCGTNAEVTNDGTSCQCLPGYQGDAKTGCTDIDECASHTSCASNQTCKNTVGSFQCAPRTCANRYGNPCGPGSACTDTASGFTCAAINQYNCPVGCGPDSSCVDGGSSSGFICQCNPGFSRSQPYLHCLPNLQMSDSTPTSSLH